MSSTTLRIDALVLTGSPRLSGEDAAHTRTLAEIDGELPPIVVHRPTMRVLDGLHRVRAATLRGESTIRAVFFDGTAEEAYLLAVRANIAHGLPLSLADRKVAAARIISMCPHWSDRAIASAAGLAPKTVAGLRPTGNHPGLDTRLGRDGRVRPVSSAEGRRRVQRMIAERPDASLREIARIVGVSPETVRDVRARLSRGEDPVARRGPGTARTTDTGPRDSGGGAPGDRPRDLVEALSVLKRDPALRFSDAGRSVLRWIDAQLIVSGNWSALAERVPAHCADTLADLATECSETLLRFAEQLKQRSPEY